MEESILTTTKKILGLPEDHTEFDLDVITHINSVFSDLTQMGVGPVDGFDIQDATPDWTSYISDDVVLLNSIKTYVYLRVRLLHDPPTTSYVLAAAEKQIEKLEWRISVHRESTEWTDPNPAPTANDELQELINIVDSQVI